MLWGFRLVFLGKQPLLYYILKDSSKKKVLTKQGNWEKERKERNRKINERKKGYKRVKSN